MSMGKFQAGWLTSDPVGQMFKLIEKGTIAVPLPFYRGVAGALLDAGMSPMISHSMPFLEMAVALSLATGVLVPAAAVGAILLNINIVLSGIGTPAFDGPIIAAEVLFVMSYRVVGGIGFERLARRILSAALRLVRPARKPAVDCRRSRPAAPSRRPLLRLRQEQGLDHGEHQHLRKHGGAIQRHERR